MSVPWYKIDAAIGNQMNIFVLDEDPWKCAEMHNNIHLLKMTTESAQLLSSAHHALAPFDKQLKGICHPYQLYHICALWTRKCDKNYQWLFELFRALGHNYKLRYNRQHSAIIKYSSLLMDPPNNIPTAETRTPFALAMPPQYQIEGDAVASYRDYYIKQKCIFSYWTPPSLPPKWWPEDILDEAYGPLHKGVVGSSVKIG